MGIKSTEGEVTEEPAPVWEPIKPARSHLSYWVRSTDRRFSKSMNRFLSEAGIIASEWAVLRQLYRPGRLSPVELGLAIGMSKGGASKLVSRLVAKGFVIKETADFDRRFRSVGLTKQGKELVVFMASIEKDADREFFSPLGNGRRFRLTEWLTRLLDTSRSEQMDRWTAMQLKQRAFSPVDPDPEAQSDADALWEYCKRMTEQAILDSLGRNEGRFT
jgi:DNA-binding MarR family transcriptional regulator